MSPAPQAHVQVQAGRPATAYDRNIFGHFVEHFHRQVYGGVFEPGSPLADERGFRLDVIDALRELGAPVVRWPGGCFVSAYHWVDGIGPDRTPTFDRAWRVSDPNTFGTDEFVQWCRAVGAQPYLCTNAGTGTADEMADWVEYCNRPAGTRWADRRVANGHAEPHAVRYWSIGNENYGDWEIGAKEPQEWARFVTECAKVMRRTDPTITLLAPAVDDLDWTIPLLRHAGPYLDSLSIHGYWDRLDEVNAPSGYLECMARTLEPERAIVRAEAAITAAALDSRVTIAFDEWNLRGWHHPRGSQPGAIEARDLNDDNSTYTMADAVFSAVFLNACLRHAETVTMANIAPTVNARGPLFVHPGGVVRRTTFHVLSMYANLLGSRVLDSSVRSASLDAAGTPVPLVDAVATADPGSERVVLALVNKSDAAQAAVSVSIGDQPLRGAHPAVVLTGAGPDSANDVGHPDAVLPQQRPLEFVDGVALLPAHSVVVCTVEAPRAPAAPPDLAWATRPGRGWSLSG